jgi:hypothetical protein
METVQIPTTVAVSGDIVVPPMPIAIVLLLLLIVLLVPRRVAAVLGRTPLPGVAKPATELGTTARIPTRIVTAVWTSPCALPIVEKIKGHDL